MHGVYLLTIPSTDRMSDCNQEYLAYWQRMLSLKVNVTEQLIKQLQTQDGGVLTCDEAACVREKPNNARKMRQIIDLLLEKGDKEFKNFCRILGMNCSNINAWAKKAQEHQAEEYTGILLTHSACFEICCSVFSASLC